MEQKQIYRCNVCGNIVEVLHVGGGTLVCCGAAMIHVEEKTKDVGSEKHVPVAMTLADGQIRVNVGEIPHPMEPNHYIEWIEIITTHDAYKKFLTPDNKPQADFCIAENEKVLKIRAYCNIHGLWIAYQ